MSVLTSKARKALPDSAFVFPKDRRYPIHDAKHARNAMARVAAYGTPTEKKAVAQKVHKRFPQIGR